MTDDNVEKVKTKEDINNLKRWAMYQRAEQGEVGKYLRTPFDLELLERLRFMEGQMILIKGELGIGKSIKTEWVADELTDELELRKDKLTCGGLEYVWSFKWLGKRTIHKMFESIRYTEFGKQMFNNLLIEHLGDRIPRRVDGSMGELPSLHKLPKRILEKIERETVVQALGSKDGVKYLLLDFPDIRDKRRSPPEIDVLRDLWEEVQEGGHSPNLVLFWQAEVPTDFHYWVIEGGKFTHLIIPPLKTKELADHVISEFHGPEPFTRDALIELDRVSRGNFRHFKELIAECLRGDPPPDQITLDDIQNMKSLDPLLSRRVEFIKMYPKSLSSRKLHLEIEQWIREQDDPVSQQDITDRFFRGKAVSSSRFLTKMEDNGCIHREKVDGQNILHLA